MNMLHLPSLLAAVALTYAQAEAQQPQPQKASGTDQVSISIRITYYQCVSGPHKGSVVLRASETCREETCRWREKSSSSNQELQLNPTAYSYRSGPPRANAYLNDMSVQLYGTPLPQTKDERLVNCRKLYNFHEEYGWIELPESQSKTGALCLWPSVGGVVVSDPAVSESTSTEKEETELQIERMLSLYSPVDEPVYESVTKRREPLLLYPSDTRNGNLRLLSSSYIVNEKPPKYLMPLSFMKATMNTARSEKAGDMTPSGTVAIEESDDGLKRVGTIPPDG
jgi:hypothetical protein